MNTVVRNILAIIAGIVIGSIINMGLIRISGSVIPPPEGADLTSMEGLKKTMHLFEPKHFLFPFLAHSLGTFAGALVAALIASAKKMRLALVIGVVFLIGGIMNVMMLPSPLWYSIVDLGLAYIPFAWMAGKIATSGRTEV